MSDKMKAILKGFYTRLRSRNTERTENKQIFLTALRKKCQEGKSDIKASPKIYVHPQLCNRLYSHSAPLQSRLLSELNVFPGQHSGYWTEALLLTSTDYVLQRDRSPGNTQTPLHAIFPTLTIQLLLSFKKCSKGFCKMTIKTFEDFMYSISPFLPKLSFPHKISLSVTCNHSAYHTNLVCHFKIPFYLWYPLYLGLFLVCFRPHRIHIFISVYPVYLYLFLLACPVYIGWVISGTGKR